MIRGFWGHYVIGWVSASSTTPLPGLCTSGQILLSNSDVTHSEICPDLQRPGSGVVGLVMTHWLTWCPQNRRIMKCGIEKIMDRCEVHSFQFTVFVFGFPESSIRTCVSSPVRLFFVVASAIEGPVFSGVRRLRAVDFFLIRAVVTCKQKIQKCSR